MNASLISNGINMNFTDRNRLEGVLRTLQASGKAMQFADYIVEKKDGEIDGARMAANF